MSENLGTVNRRRVKAVNAEGEPLVGCRTCKGSGKTSSSMVRGWKSACVSCNGTGLTKAYGEWKKPAVRP